MSDVCLVTNLPAPYRLPVFEELADHHDLTVKFLKRTDPSRNWSGELDGYSFEYEFLNVPELPALQVDADVRSVLDGETYDACIVGEAPMHALAVIYLMRVAKKEDVPLAIWTEGVDVERTSPRTVRAAFSAAGRRAYDATIRRYTYSMADAFVAYSGAMTRRFLEARGVDGERIITGTQVMPRSLLGPRDGPGDGRGNRPDTTTVLYLGYLRRAKGVDVLIEAFDGLGRPGIELVVAGDGPDAERLRSLAAGVDRVRFPGFVTGESKWELYRDADLFVLPTFIDTWGLVVNEAMFFGTPVITTDAAGASQLVSESDAGAVVPPGDVDGLQDAMVEILESPELQSTYGNNARTCEEAWDPAVGAEPFLRTIERLTGQG